MKIHPASQILIWCLLVAAMQFLPPCRLVIAGVTSLLFAFVLSRHKFIQLVRRTRWIMFSLWLIYALTTPGLPLSESLGSLSPTREGLQEGGLQLIRLLVALAGLAILLDRLHRVQLMAGLYSLFRPLSWAGLSRERMAVRLALTLHYAEVALLRESRSWQAVLHSLDENQAETSTSLELPVYLFTSRDALLLTGSSLLLWLAI